MRKLFLVSIALLFLVVAQGSKAEPPGRISQEGVVVWAIQDQKPPYQVLVFDSDTTPWLGWAGNIWAGWDRAGTGDTLTLYLPDPAPVAPCGSGTCYLSKVQYRFYSQTSVEVYVTFPNDAAFSLGLYGDHLPYTLLVGPPRLVFNLPPQVEEVWHLIPFYGSSYYWAYSHRE